MIANKLHDIRRGDGEPLYEDATSPYGIENALRKWKFRYVHDRERIVDEPSANRGSVLWTGTSRARRRPIELSER